MVRSGIVLLAISGTAVAVMPQQAAAQTTDDRILDRIEARIDRIDSGDSRSPEFFALDGAAPKIQDFTLSFGLPVAFNSNVELAENNVKGSLHVAPSLSLEYKHKFDVLVISARINADSDSLTEYTSYNSSSLGGRFALTLDTPALGILKPYVSYTPLAAYGGGFANHVVTTHTAAIGIGGEVGDKKKVLFGFDINGQRRYASLASSEQERYQLQVSLGGDFKDSVVGWKIAQLVSRRIYVGGTNIGRHDTYLKTEAALSIKLNPGASTGMPIFGIDIAAAYQRNDSNRTGKSYSAWDVGPRFGVKIKF